MNVKLLRQSDLLYQMSLIGLSMPIYDVLAQDQTEGLAGLACRSMPGLSKDCQSVCSTIAQSASYNDEAYLTAKFG